jgi:hypothetical protein
MKELGVFMSNIPSHEFSPANLWYRALADVDYPINISGATYDDGTEMPELLRVTTDSFETALTIHRIRGVYGTHSKYNNFIYEIGAGNTTYLFRAITNPNSLTFPNTDLRDLPVTLASRGFMTAYEINRDKDPQLVTEEDFMAKKLRIALRDSYGIEKQRNSPQHELAVYKRLQREGIKPLTSMDLRLLIIQGIRWAEVNYEDGIPITETYPS